MWTQEGIYDLPKWYTRQPVVCHKRGHRRGVMTYLTVPCPISYSHLHAVLLFLVSSASCKAFDAACRGVAAIFFCMRRNTVAHSRFPTCKGVAGSKFRRAPTIVTILPGKVSWIFLSFYACPINCLFTSLDEAFL